MGSDTDLHSRGVTLDVERPSVCARRLPSEGGCGGLALARASQGSEFGVRWGNSGMGSQAGSSARLRDQRGTSRRRAVLDG